MKMKVSSWDHFSPLKHVIVGRADHCCVSDKEPATGVNKVPMDCEMKGRWGLRPLSRVEKANAQLDNFADILQKRGIRVDRPEVIQFNQPIITPDFKTSTMVGCQPPRDVLLLIGNRMIECPMSLRCRWFEYLVYRPLLEKYFDADPNFRWESAPRPRLTADSYRPGYWDESVTKEQRQQWVKDKYFVTTEKEPLFDAADVLRIGKDLFCQHALSTNRKGMEWLQRSFPEHRVHSLNFPGDLYPMHIDATFITLKPGTCITAPTRPILPEHRQIFEANGWQIIDAAQPAHTEMPPMCPFTPWLSLNCLILDPKTVCIEASEVNAMEQMDKLGMEVVPVPFRDAYEFGGGLHCSTADVYREGAFEDYFPKQVGPTRIR